MKKTMKSGDTVKILTRPHGTIEGYKHLIGKQGVVDSLVTNNMDDFVLVQVEGIVHWWRMDGVEKCVK